MEKIKRRTSLGLVGIVLIGIILRIINISPLKIYPDSYQNLLVASNLARNGIVVGRMGDGGMTYPDYLAWTRPGTPILINLASYFINDTDRAAYTIVVLNGVLGILGGYFLVSKIFRSKWAGLAGALLVAVSFDHIVWGGFVLTETTGVMIQFLVLGMLSSNLKDQVKPADTRDLVTGTVLAAGILTRYEYTVLLLPMVYLIVKESPNYKTKLLNIGSAMVFVLALAVKILFPAFPWIGMVSQTVDSFKTIGAAAGLILIGGMVLNRLKLFKKSFLGLVWAAAGASIFWVQLSGLKYFALYNFSLVVLFLIGISDMLNSAKYKNWAYLSLLALFSLGPVYIQMNHEMQRYWTHLIPYFLIPAVYGIKSVRWPKIAGQEIKNRALFGMLALQLVVSAKGIKQWGEGAWFTKNYEENNARIIRPEIKESNLILLTSLPEPYFYATKLTTHSIADTPPFLFIEGFSDSIPVYVVQDMGMFDQFPHFNEFINKSLSKYKIKEFYTNGIYHYGPMYKKENVPVKVFKINYGELRRLIDTYQYNQ